MDYINEFDIHLDKEYFYPGELLTGYVLLKTTENFKLKAIKVLLRGKANCQWKMMIQNEKRTVKDEEMFIEDRSLIFGNEKSEQYAPILTRGKHVFNFQFQLPESQLPCSFESKFCTIRYYVKVTLDIPYSSPPQGIKYFSIIGPHLDCMDQKYLKPLTANKTDKICCFCTTTYITQLKCQLERSAFCAGEIVRVKAYIHNKSSSPVRLGIKLTQYYNCNINRGVIGLSKQSNHTVLEYRGDEEIGIDSRSKFDSGNSLILPTMPPTIDADVCRLMNLSYVLKVWIESDKSEILKILFPITIATSPFRIPNSDNQPTINYENCVDYVEGGLYIGPEFQLGQVYDGTHSKEDDVVLYRPLYVCVKSRRNLLKDMTTHSKEGSKDSSHLKDLKDSKDSSKDSHLKESHSKHSSVSKEEMVVVESTSGQSTSGQQPSTKRKQKRQSLKNQHSLDISLEMDRSPEMSESLAHQSRMSFHKMRLSSLDEQQIIELDRHNLALTNQSITKSDVISSQPKGSSRYHQ